VSARVSTPNRGGDAVRGSAAAARSRRVGRESMPGEGGHRSPPLGALPPACARAPRLEDAEDQQQGKREDRGDEQRAHTAQAVGEEEEQRGTSGRERPGYPATRRVNRRPPGGGPLERYRRPARGRREATGRPQGGPRPRRGAARRRPARPRSPAGACAARPRAIAWRHAPARRPGPRRSRAAGTGTAARRSRPRRPVRRTAAVGGREPRSGSRSPARRRAGPLRGGLAQ
jgi:hypothetical protein